MRIAMVSFYYDENLKAEESFLEQNYTITGWAEALQRKGVEVIVISRFYRSSAFTKNNVQYIFFNDKLGGTFRSWQMPYQFLKMISALRADVVHLHHLTLSLQTFLLRVLSNKQTAIIVQHHGGKAPAKLKRFLHNSIHHAADGFFFTTIEQGREWFMGKKQHQNVLPVMEGATFFDYNDRDKARKGDYYDRCEARKITGMRGSPVFLWVGRLDDNKDPITILNGFEIILDDFPAANLYLIFSDDRLIAEVKQKCESSSLLKSHVFLIGKVAHEQIEMYYNSADYFVLGSHYEGSGYALSEALRCGCVPIVTDIPSFNMMTDNGKLGSLWRVGHTGSFVMAAKNALSKPISEEGRACIHYYNKTLSFDAIAENAIIHYGNVIMKRRKSMTAIFNA